MLRIIDPSTNRTVDFDKITKLQLARLVNAHAERIKILDRNVKLCVRALATIVEDADAVRREGKRVVLAKEAVDRIASGTDLHFQEHPDRLEVYTTPPADVPALVLPSIVVPRTV